MITFTDISAYKKSTDVAFFVTKIGINGKNEIVFAEMLFPQSGCRLTSRELIVMMSQPRDYQTSPLPVKWE